MFETSTAFDPPDISTTGEGETSMDYEFDIVHIVFCLILSLLILATNAFIVYVLKKGRYYFDEASSFLFKILAYTDIVGGTSGALIHAFYFVFIKDAISDNICQCVPFFIAYCSMNSLYLVCLINAQRYFAVTRPFKYMRLATVERFKIVVCISIFFVTCLTIILLPIEGFPFTPIFALTCSDQYGEGIIISSVKTKIGLSFMIIAIALPLLVLSVLNYRLLAIAYRASRDSRRLPKVPTQSHPNEQNSSTSCKHIAIANYSEKTSHPHAAFRSGLKGLKTVVVISVLFHVSCLPFALSLILTITRGEQSYYLYFVSLALLLCNCWWNGPVYFLTSKTFRKKSLEVLGLEKRWRNPAETSTRESSFAQNSQHLNHNIL